MARDGFIPMKLKRKDIDDFNDDFSDFSLSAPARKIRRLDAELPPIMEEEEPEMPVFQERSSIEVEPEPEPEPEPVFAANNNHNEERAIVLFKPLHANFPSPSNVTVSVDPDIITGFNKNTNQFFSSSNFGNMKWARDEDAEQNRSNRCLAVVPWVPSKPPSTAGIEVTQMEGPGLMEGDELGEAAMDVEDSNDASVGPVNAYDSNGAVVAEGLQSWQQQHCMIPQLPQSTSTPITWFR